MLSIITLRLHATHLLFLLTSTFLLPFVQATCYLPNGTAHDDPGTALCSTDASNPLHNVCCHTRWANPSGGDVINGPTADICLPNGLCENRGNSSIVGQEQGPWERYYKVYCANADWSGCLNVCSGASNGSDVTQLTPCDGTPTSEKWCCGDTTNCCTPGGTVEAVTIPSILASNNTSASPSATSTSSPTPPHNKNTTAIIAGSVVGGVAVLLAAAFLLWRRNQKYKKVGQREPIYEAPSHDVKDVRPMEMSDEQRHELQGDKLSRPEL